MKKKKKKPDVVCRPISLTSIQEVNTGRCHKFEASLVYL